MVRCCSLAPSLFSSPGSALPTWQVRSTVRCKYFEICSDGDLDPSATFFISYPGLYLAHHITSNQINQPFFFLWAFFCGFLSACPTLGLRSPWTCIQCVCLCLLYVVPRITWRNTSQVNQTNQPTNQTCDILTNSCRGADQRIQIRRWHACMHAWDEPANHPFSPLETSNKQRHAYPHIHTHLIQSRQLLQRLRRVAEAKLSLAPGQRFGSPGPPLALALLPRWLRGFLFSWLHVPSKHTNHTRWLEGAGLLWAGLRCRNTQALHVAGAGLTKTTGKISRGCSAVDKVRAVPGR